uniref:Avl9 domain-containing protein n=1 Tax=Echinostoma caproni TaxID=27848 RepID=A0A183BDF7_9TREM
LGHLDFLLEWEMEGNQSDGQAVLGRGRCVRGFLAGATNPLLRTHKQLAEVIVMTLPPSDGLSDPRVNQSSGELTSLFEKNLKPLESGNGSSEGAEKQQSTVPKPPVSQSRGFTLPKRTSQIIRVNAADPASSDSRNMPTPLAQALQLSRMDRLFVDELVRTVVLWYQAKTHLMDSTVLPSDVDLGELLSRDENVNLIDRYLSGLTPAQRTVLMRFPTASILDTWIRQQFQTYLRALLLTADGYSECFN